MKSQVWNDLVIEPKQPILLIYFFKKKEKG